MRKLLAAALAALTLGAVLPSGSGQSALAPAAAIDPAALRPLVEKYLKEEATAIAADPRVIAAVKAANVEHAALDDAAIQALDRQWRQEAKVGTGPLVTGLLARPVSAALRDYQAKSLGLMAEIFVISAKGLNVGQTGVTSDYFQGDEPKWQETFPKGPGALLVEDPNFDESVNTFVSTASITIADPATGAAIGVLTVNIDLGRL
ncbi:hypothetical protein [Rhodocista pekingensis]|uniref:Uncharacterized protein n=1 Tax=Rhodocista pekingensis TaxID=201185 RepID=A0ABW2L043_9PROT